MGHRMCSSRNAWSLCECACGEHVDPVGNVPIETLITYHLITYLRIVNAYSFFSWIFGFTFGIYVNETITFYEFSRDLINFWHFSNNKKMKYFSNPIENEEFQQKKKFSKIQKNNKNWKFNHYKTTVIPNIILIHRKLHSRKSAFSRGKIGKACIEK